MIERVVFRHCVAATLLAAGSAWVAGANAVADTYVSTSAASAIVKFPMATTTGYDVRMGSRADE